VIEVQDRLYLELLKKTLIGSLAPIRTCPVKGTTPFRRALYRPVESMLASRGLRLVREVPESTRWGLTDAALTLLSMERLENIQTCVENVLRDGVPGDLMETGVWRGGATILMRALLKIHGVTDRRVWLADSFRGLPPPDAEAYPKDRGDIHHMLEYHEVSMESVQANFAKFGLLDDQVRFLKGWFKDTLPSAPVERLAVLRLDGDMYQSTMESLQALYARVSVGGYVIVDDYGDKPGCQVAIRDFRREHGITEPLQPVHDVAVFWQRLSG
jgi:hypothetical protein